MTVKMPSPRVRRYLYRIGLAAVPLLVAYGVVTQEYAALWSVAFGAVLAIADANVPDGEDE